MASKGSARPATQLTTQFAVGGGLDLVTPAIIKTPGLCISALNHEPRPEGYRRIDGHERFDGRPAPSAQSYWLITFTGGSAAINVGDTVTGNTSGATGVAVLAGIVVSGSYGASNAVGTVVLRLVTGTFVNAEALKVGGVTKSTSSSAALSRAASPDSLDNTYLGNAMEAARALIQPVPGSGPILGVWYYNGVCYAFRNNVGGSAALMYASSAAGWTAVNLGSTLAFSTGGTTPITEGQTITGATSGASGVVKRIVVTTGVGIWDTTSSANAGVLVFQTITGTFSNAENLQVSAVTMAEVVGTQAVTTLLPGGSFEFITNNFFGASNLKRMYGCDGVNKAFEFDGTVFVPISTGMPVDAPNHIQANYNHLFLSFPGGSIQNSSIGLPYLWSAILGAAEIGLGDDVTGMLAGYNSIMVIYGRNKTSILYGTDATTWQLKDLSIVDGAYPGTAQLLINPTTYDNFGIRGLETIVPTIANFAPATLSTQIRPLIDAYNSNLVTPTASLRVRRKNQYRLFFSDGTGIVMDMSTSGSNGSPIPQFMPLNYGKTVRCACSAKDNDGNELEFFGSDDGYIYQADSGNNFDGQPVTAFLRLAFNNIKSATQNKRFHKATLELASAQPNTAIICSAEFSGGDPNQPGQQPETFSVSGAGAFWDEANWEQFYWSSQIIGIAEARIDGAGTNISLSIGSTLTYETPYVVSGVTIHYSMRGLKR